MLRRLCNCVRRMKVEAGLCGLLKSISMIHFTDYYLKTGIKERVAWGHDPDPFEIQCHAKNHFGGWENVFQTDSFPANGPTYSLYSFIYGNWVENIISE